MWESDRGHWDVGDTRCYRLHGRCLFDTVGRVSDNAQARSNHILCGFNQARYIVINKVTDLINDSSSPSNQP